MASPIVWTVSIPHVVSPGWHMCAREDVSGMCEVSHTLCVMYVCLSVCVWLAVGQFVGKSTFMHCVCVCVPVSV